MDGRADSWKARDICEVISDNEYTETFELARPAKPFEVYSREERKQWLARLDSEALRARVGGSKRGQLSVYGVQGHHLPVPRGQLFRVRKMSENRTWWELQEI